MRKSELESKPLSELHTLAAEKGVERYRMLSKAELVEQLADDGEPGGGGGSPRSGSRGDSGRTRQRDRERKPRQQRQRQRDRGDRGGGQRQGGRRPEKPARQPEPEPEPQAGAEAAAAAASDRPRRKRRRRRWGRRRKDVSVQDLLLPATGARTIVYAESRESCTALLREVAADLSGSDGPDPIALLVDPTPVELAEWKRDAPAVEIVSAGQARHAGDAVAQATRRAEAGEDVIVLIDSLSRFAEAFKAANEAKELFEAGQNVGGSGSLTVVAAVERSE
jgi:hypothetical protein